MAAPPRGRFDAGRTFAGIALLCLAAAAATVLGVATMSVGAARKPAAPSPPPMSDAQARSLASMRYNNLGDGRVAFHADLGSPGTGARVGGWIDWRRPMVYLASLAATPGPADGLVQAVPGLIAIHPGRVANPPDMTNAPGGYPTPPGTPPADGWRLRPLDPATASGAAFDELVTLLFGLAADEPDNLAQVAGSGTRFLRRDTVSRVPVSVFTAPPQHSGDGREAGPPFHPLPLSGSPSPSISPVPPPSAPRSTPPTRSPGATPSPRSPGATPPISSIPSSQSNQSTQSTQSPWGSVAGSATYWLDDASRLRRLDTVLGADLPVRVDFDRVTVPALNAIALLGGAPVQPRPVSADEAWTLAELPVRDRGAKGGPVTMVVPVGVAGMVSGTGWLDWRVPACYLALHELDDPASGTLLRADRTGLISRTDPGAGSATAPPLRPPIDGWAQTTWARHAGDPGTVDIDALLMTLVNLGGGTRQDPSRLRTTANWLRTDSINTVPVTVFEIRGPTETAAPGHAALRYWVGRDGVLRRLEIRTGSGGYGYLDLTPGTPPLLPKPIAKRS